MIDAETDVRGAVHTIELLCLVVILHLIVT
jgi:hypothetical protein